MEIYQFNKKLFTYNGRPLYTGSIGGGGGSYPTDSLWALWRFNGDILDSYNSNNLSGSASSYPSGGVPSNMSNCGLFTKPGYAYLDNAVFNLGSNPLSISYWFYATSTAVGHTFGTAGNAYQRNGMLAAVFNGNGTLNYGVRYSGIGGYERTYSYTANQWNHFVFSSWISSGVYFTLYINNVEQDSGYYANSSNMYSITYLGVNSTPDHHSGPGTLTGVNMSSMFIYTKVLSESEIAQLYNGGAGI